VVGGGGADGLIANGSGVIPVTGVSGVGYFLIEGGGTVALTDANFTNLTGPMAVNPINGGTVDGSAVSVGHTVFFIGSNAPDNFIGGSGVNVFLFSAAQLSTADTITGGHTDVLLLTSAGVIDTSGVSGVGFYELASGGSNSLVVSNANLMGLPTFGVQAGSGGDSIDASGVMSSSTQMYLFGGSGDDTLKAGAANTILVSGGGMDTLIGGSGPDVFAPSSSGVSTILGFRSGVDVLFFSAAQFDLGASDVSGSTFGHLDPSAFSTAADGSFATSQERFSFDSATHELLYAVHGSATAPSAIDEIAILGNITTLHSYDLFFGH
jgi:Ca2+-binding RTX toxin-like protein